MIAMISRTIEATTMVTMMIRLEVPPYFSKPTPEIYQLERSKIVDNSNLNGYFRHLFNKAL